ncbi:hypothetical protein NECAME_10527 [Necator americanus]|uniref:Uncharacterized protein n=1 Tax=Necator americanus TaxID=51031 RepID=W2T8G1_NECAM|nr:hypothetical protein NECAME_10527 [Necator americanus]ETN78173.1 hypothetical protein NECAME_10527 [Necator americanus]
MGDMCDMSCSTAATANNFVICTNNRTGEHFNCTYNSYNAQVSQCALCATGSTAFNGTCVVPIKEVYLGVSKAFRIWTIVLGCLLGIAVLLLLCLIITYIIVKNRERYDERLYNTSNVYTNGQAGRRLLEEEKVSKIASVKGRERYDDGSAYRTSKTTGVSGVYANGQAGRHLFEEEDITKSASVKGRECYDQGSTYRTSRTTGVSGVYTDGQAGRHLLEEEDITKSASVKSRGRYDEGSANRTRKATDVYTNGHAVRPLIQEEEWTTITRRPITTELESSYIRTGVTTTTTTSRQEHQV